MWLCMGKKRSSSKRPQGNSPMCPRSKSSSPDPPPLPHPARHAGLQRAAAAGSRNSRASSSSTPPITPRQLRQADGHSADSLSLRDISELDTPDLSVRSSESGAQKKICRVFNVQQDDDHPIDVSLENDDDDEIVAVGEREPEESPTEDETLQKGSSRTLYDTSKSETNLLSVGTNVPVITKMISSEKQEIRPKDFVEGKSSDENELELHVPADDVDAQSDTSFRSFSSVSKSSTDMLSPSKPKVLHNNGHSSTPDGKTYKNINDLVGKRNNTIEVQPTARRKQENIERNITSTNSEAGKQEETMSKPMTFRIYSTNGESSFARDSSPAGDTVHTKDNTFNFKVSSPKPITEQPQLATDDNKQSNQKQLYEVRQQIVPDSEDEDFGTEVAPYSIHARSRIDGIWASGAANFVGSNKSRSFSMDNIYPPTVSRHSGAAESGRGQHRNHSQGPVDTLVRNASSRSIGRDKSALNPLANLDFLTQDLLAIANSLGTYSASKPSQKSDGSYDDDEEGPSLERFTAIRLNILKSTSKLLDFVSGILKNPRGTFDLDTISLLCMQLKTNLHILENFVLDLLECTSHKDMDQLEKRLRKQLKFMKEVNTGISRYLESIEKRHESSGSTRELDKEGSAVNGNEDDNVKLGNVVLLTRGIPLIIRSLASFITKLLEPPAVTPSVSSSTDERLMAISGDESKSDISTASGRFPADGMPANGNSKTTDVTSAKGTSKKVQDIERRSPTTRNSVNGRSHDGSFPTNGDIIDKQLRRKESIKEKQKQRSVSADRSDERESSQTLERRQRNRSVDVLGSDEVPSSSVHQATSDIIVSSIQYQEGSHPTSPVSKARIKSTTAENQRDSSDTREVTVRVEPPTVSTVVFDHTVASKTESSGQLDGSTENQHYQETTERLLPPPRRRNIVSTSLCSSLIKSNDTLLPDDSARQTLSEAVSEVKMTPPSETRKDPNSQELDRRFKNNQSPSAVANVELHSELRNLDTQANTCLEEQQARLVSERQYSRLDGAEGIKSTDSVIDQPQREHTTSSLVSNGSSCKPSTKDQLKSQATPPLKSSAPSRPAPPAQHVSNKLSQLKGDSNSSAVKPSIHSSPMSPSDYDNPRSPTSPPISGKVVFPSPRLKKKQQRQDTPNPNETARPPALPPKTKNYEMFRQDSAFDHDPLYLLGQNLLDRSSDVNSRRQNIYNQLPQHSNSSNSLPVTSLQSVGLTTSPPLRRASFGEKARASNISKSKVGFGSEVMKNRDRSTVSGYNAGSMEFGQRSNSIMRVEENNESVHGKGNTQFQVASMQKQQQPFQHQQLQQHKQHQFTVLQQPQAQSLNYTFSKSQTIYPSEDKVVNASPPEKQLLSSLPSSPSASHQSPLNRAKQTHAYTQGQQIQPSQKQEQFSTSKQQNLSWNSAPQQPRMVNQQVLHMTERLGSDNWISTSDLTTPDLHASGVSATTLKELEELKRQADNFSVSSHTDIIGGLDRYTTNAGLPSGTFPRSSEKQGALQIKISTDHHHYDLNDNVLRKGISPASPLSPRHSVHFYPIEHFDNTSNTKDYSNHRSPTSKSILPDGGLLVKSGSGLLPSPTSKDIQPSVGSHQEDDSRLLLFYCDQISQHWTVIDSAASAFFRCVDRRQPPKIFIAHCQFVLLAGRKMSQLGDLLVNSLNSDDKRHWVESYSNRLCDALKTAARATRDAAINYPSIPLQQAMVDGVKDVTDWALDLKDMVFRLAYLSRSLQIASISAGY